MWSNTKFMAAMNVCGILAIAFCFYQMKHGGNWIVPFTIGVACEGVYVFSLFRKSVK
jgi:hypothetical protein